MDSQNAQNENVSLILSSDTKPRLKWTPELHQRFIDAIDQLGGSGRATPKSLMRIMGIHGLTLYHLKSHLQKYRLGKSQNSQGRGENEQEYKENERSQMMDEICEGDREPSDGTLEISQALQIQMEVQKNLCQQVEVQKHLQLRIEAQGKYLQSVLQKAQETLAIYNSSSIGIEPTKAELSKILSMPKNAEPMQSGRNGCSLESSLTSSENSKTKDDDDDQEKTDSSNIEKLKRDSTSLRYLEVNSSRGNGSNVNRIGSKRGVDEIVDENGDAQQSRNCQELKTFKFLESLDLNTN